jgi:hypothetical protein
MSVNILTVISNMKFSRIKPTFRRNVSLPTSRSNIS